MTSALVQNSKNARVLEIHQVYLPNLSHTVIGIEHVYLVIYLPRLLALILVVILGNSGCTRKRHVR